MNIKLNNCDFHKSPWLCVPLPDALVDLLDMQHFDKDGYEITALLERTYYEQNGVPLNTTTQKHTTTAVEWFIDDTESESGLVLDHSMIMTRWGFGGDARKQLAERLDSRPILNKLLKIKPKWGIDFSLDWVDTEDVIEIIHIEQDFNSYEEANVAKRAFEALVMSTEWEQSAKDLLRIKPQWQHLSSDDQSDFKAKFFNWHRAFDNIKVF